MGRALHRNEISRGIWPKTNRLPAERSHGSAVALRWCTLEERQMNFATAADRIRSDFNEMPRLELTIGQGVRLWNLGADDCRNVLDALVDPGFLQWTTRRTIVRAGNDRRRDGMEPEISYISVRLSKASDISMQPP